MYAYIHICIPDLQGIPYELQYHSYFSVLNDFAWVFFRSLIYPVFDLFGIIVSCACGNACCIHTFVFM